MNIWEFIEKGYGHGNLESLKLYLQIEDDGILYRVTHLRSDEISLSNRSENYCRLRKAARLEVRRVSQTRTAFNQFRTTLHIDHVRKPQ